MSVRRVVLVLGAVLVLALGIYLFIQVRAQIAPPQVAIAPVRAKGSAEPTAPAVPLATPHREVVDAAVPATSEDPPSQPQAKVGLQVPEGEARDAGVDAGSGTEPPLEGRRLEAVMKEANRAYDRGDYDEAKTIAGKVLAVYPTNIRMLRIIVSASCIDGDNALAQANIGKLPPWDQDQMKTRCARYGVTFP